MSEEGNPPSPGQVVPEITADPKGVEVSKITFADGGSSASAGRPTADEARTERTTTSGNTLEGRKINRRDVENVFRATTTTGVVSQEQIARIKRMHDKISDGVRWDFNYSCLLMVASVVAGIGLATDSPTTVISSMLLSPIMGPVIGMSYGLIIWDWPLIKRSARNEVLSIICCIIFGLLTGVCWYWAPAAKDWPTEEMLSRATPQTFFSGFPIAFFSGLGVALSVLDDQTSSLVGVAISASLLPPAVNSGVLWIMAINRQDISDLSFHYSVDLSGYTNFGQMALVSLLLTLANVVMVAAGATLMFRLKEVLPVTKKVFWEDLKTARRIYQGRALDSESGEVLDRVVVA